MTANSVSLSSLKDFYQTLEPYVSDQETAQQTYPVFELDERGQAPRYYGKPIPLQAKIHLSCSKAKTLDVEIKYFDISNTGLACIEDTIRGTIQKLGMQVGTYRSGYEESYLNKYTEIIQSLNEKGYSVLANDTGNHIDCDVLIDSLFEGVE